MHPKLFRNSALFCMIFATACSQPESALMDDSDQSKISVQNQMATPSQSQSVRLIETPHRNVPNHAQPHQSARKEKTPADLTPITPPAAPTPFAVKRCINLGNALEAPNEGEWGYKIRAQDLATIKRTGFDTVRLPVRWDAHTANRPPYSIDAAFMTRVQSVVAQAQASGLGVILDVHHFKKLMNRPSRQEARFLAIWEQIADTFKDLPPNIYFEVLNEPTREISMSEVNALYAKVIPIIRASNPTRKIIIGGNSWSSVETMADVNWPDDPNIVATFHDYGPHAFTHQGAEWSEPVMPMGRRWGGRDDENELKSTYDIAIAFRAKTGLPLLVGEFGVIEKVPLAQRMQWTKVRRQTMEANNIAWCAWDFSGAFKMYDVTTEQWLPGVQDALFGP